MASPALTLLMARRSHVEPTPSAPRPHAPQFTHRHLGPRDSDVKKMLGVVGNFGSLDALTASTVPADIAFPSGFTMDLPGPMGETDALAKLKAIAAKNKVRGMG